MAGGSGDLEELGVEVAGAEEVDVHADAGLGSDVPDVVTVGERLDVLDGGEVCAEGKVGDELGHLAEAGEDDAVRHVGVHGREAKGHGGPERVAEVDRLVVLVRHAAEESGAGAVGEGLEGGDFEEDLDLVDGLAVRGVAEAEAVPRQRRVAGADGARHVAVVVVVVGQVPVAAVESDPVSEDLERVAGTGVGLTVCGCELVVSRNRLVLYVGPIENKLRVSSLDCFLVVQTFFFFISNLGNQGKKKKEGGLCLRL